MTRIDQVIHPQVHTHGPVAPQAAEYAVRKLEAALHHAPAAVLHCSLTLDAAAPGDRVDAHVDVNGTGLHVHAVGASLQEATDAMQERLRSRLRRIRRRPAQGPPAPAPNAVPRDDDPAADTTAEPDRQDGTPSA
jgi:ribosome-associated translation inhibitor RaiA